MSFENIYKTVFILIATAMLLAMNGIAISELQKTDEISLIEAASAGEATRISELIKDGVNINTTDECGRTALMEASRRGYDQIVSMLLAAGANVNAQTRSSHSVEAISKQTGKICGFGFTALSEAAQRGHREIVRKLLVAGADVSSPSRALHNAAVSGHKEIVALLLNAGHDINETNSFGRTALSVAAMMGHADIVRLLVNEGADVGKNSDALSQAASAGGKEIVRLLLDAGHDIEAKKTLLGHTPLQSAAWSGHNEIIRMLLDAGANINAQGKLGDNQIQQNPPPDAPAQTALMLAVAANHAETVRILLNEDANVEAISYFGTALGLAASNGYIEIIRMLLAAGADVNAEDMHGRTALTMTRNPEVISILREAGADLKKINPGFLWDVGSIFPAMIAAFIGIFAFYSNRTDINRENINHDTLRFLSKECYILFFYVCNTIAFIFAYAGLFLFWSPGYFQYSEYFGYSAAAFLMLALVSIPLVGIMLWIDRHRHSWRALWTVFLGFLGLFITAVLWYLNHFIELIFS